jgi:cytochrome c
MFRDGELEMTVPKLALIGAATAVAAAMIIPAAIQAAPAGPSGETLFRQRCIMCHQVSPGAVSPLGPNLRGVVGRTAGSAAFKYSPPMKASKIAWNAATLDRYLTSPPRMVPGSKMIVAVPDAAHRRALIAYLSTLR